MAVFEKQYTRDTSVTVQQGWFTVLDAGIEVLGWMNPYKPAVIHFMNDGATEIWEHREATAWLLDRLLQENTKNPSFFYAQMDEYRSCLIKLQPYWEKGFTDDIHELKTFIEIVFSGMLGFVLMYYSSLDERTPKEIQAVVLPLREKDIFFDANDRYIRKSLRSIYPSLAGLETTILWQEILNVPERKVLEERKKHFIFMGDVFSAAISLEQFIREHPEYQFTFEVMPEVSETLRGSTGCAGSATGRVRILKRKEQIGELQEGEIIVSAMTTPDFVPAMKKAAAIITDEGGIMCHAAIVSRELGKPCVIGTKFATQVLKDGDEVEVNATKGLVRILKSIKDYD